ncbi:GNAT family N-acetyltransferase [Planococcus sp. FY231025]|uniref:GNAT family N-acetyltransferase n=1 Tax=Planococcus sp. FY231025 TaxID=3455699 RepID=UPI003F913D37
MIEIRKAVPDDVHGIRKVCSDGYRKTYPGLLPEERIEAIIEEFYNGKRIAKEVSNTGREWTGWFIVVDGGQVVGAGGGGMTGEETAELFVLYLAPDRKREGIGSKLLAVITEDQVRRGAKEQWVSIAKGNAMGIPFYEAVGFDLQEERPAYGTSEEEGYRSLRYRRMLR